jgi:signal recognition particle receptor subunit beta
MRVNAAKQSMSLKVVYYGPGMCGKTTNLQFLHQQVPEKQRGAMVKLDTETERTLFFDYFPLSLGTIGGYKLKVDFFTVPGQSFYQATRRVLLEGVDGIVFVADSSPDREEANLVSHDDMERNLRQYGKDPSRIPRVYQWNKRDLSSKLPVSRLERTLNRGGMPSFEATASNGTGVMETQSALLKLVLDQVRSASRGASRG